MADSLRKEPFFSAGDEGTRRAYYPKNLLTEAELPFFSQLQQALPEYGVFPQVCMGALIDPPGHLRGEWRKRARYAYQSKIVDFVVWNPELNKVVCLVELDDPSHDNRQDEDAQRDAITAEAGYPTARFDVRKLPDLAAIRQTVITAKVPEKRTESAEVLPFTKPKSGSPNRQRRRRSHSSGPSVSAVLVRLVCIGAFAIVMFKVVLPWFGVWATQQIMAPFVQRVSQSKTGSPGALPHRSSASTQGVRITRQPCMVYENRDAIALSLMRGCKYQEVATFVPVISPAQLQGWYAYDLARLNGAPGCAPYAQWSQEIMADRDNDMLDIYKRLDLLFNDAIAKGCMRAPT